MTVCRKPSLKGKHVPKVKSADVAAGALVISLGEFATWLDKRLNISGALFEIATLGGGFAILSG